MQNNAPPNHPPEPWSLRRGAKQSQGEWYSRGYLPHRDSAVLIQHVTVHLADSLPREAVEKVNLSVRLLPEGQRRNTRRDRLHDLVDAGHGSCILRIPAAADMVQDTLLYFHAVRYTLHAWVVMPNHFHVLFETLDDWSMPAVVASWKKYTARRIRDYLDNAAQEEAFTSAGQETGDPHRAECPEAAERFAGQETGDPHRAECQEAVTQSGFSGSSTASRTGGKRKEHFWHREFWDRYIRDEEHYWDTIEYIHNNPVKAGLVKSPEDWPWSSAGRVVIAEG